MDRADAEALALRVMEEHGLLEAGWTFGWSRARRALGMTQWDAHGGPDRIVLSGPCVDVNDEAVVENTVRHEVAHALAGHAAGHGPEWQAACRVTGATPERCRTDGVRLPHRWLGVCPRCGEVRARRDRVTSRARGFSCAPCVDAATTMAEALAVPTLSWQPNG